MQRRPLPHRSKRGIAHSATLQKTLHNAPVFQCSPGSPTSEKAREGAEIILPVGTPSLEKPATRMSCGLFLWMLSKNRAVLLTLLRQGAGMSKRGSHIPKPATHATLLPPNVPAASSRAFTFCQHANSAWLSCWTSPRCFSVRRCLGKQASVAP